MDCTPVSAIGAVQSDEHSRIGFRVITTGGETDSFGISLMKNRGDRQRLLMNAIVGVVEFSIYTRLPSEKRSEKLSEGQHMNLLLFGQT